MRYLLLVCLLACSGSSATVIKDVAAGAALVLCVDDQIAAGASVVDIVAKCGEDAKALIESRQALAKKRSAPCTIVTPDAGVPTGPGR